MHATTILGCLTFLAAQSSVLGVATDQQIPLQKPVTKTSDAHFTVREQSPEICDAGSKQWSGTVNVTDDKSMFFFPYRGPGATDELGMFKGIGPCAVNKDGNSTRRLEYSWIDHANVIFIDFLSIFTKFIFPELTDRPWHIAGESMGGHYVSGYTTYIINQERERSHQGLDLGLDIQSTIIVDGYIDKSRHVIGLYDFFCSDWRGDGRQAPLINLTVCMKMGAEVAACEEKGALCRQTYDKDLCFWASEWCDEKVGKHVMDEVRPGGWNPYDSRLECKKPPLCSDFDKDEVWEFFNQPWVQERLGFSNLSFSLIDFEANVRWQKARHLYEPVTRELTFLLDDTDVHILFINGNNDITISTPGQMRMLDEQPWKRQPQFRNMKYQNWFYKDGELSVDDGGSSHLGGTWKGDDKLSFYTVDEAGHFSPMNQPEAIGAVSTQKCHGCACSHHERNLMSSAPPTSPAPLLRYPTLPDRSVNNAESWTMLEHTPSSASAASPQPGTSGLYSSDPGSDSQLCIFAELLIPGRGEPIPNAAVGISVEDGIITYIGPQAQMHQALWTAPRTCVRYLLPGLWDCHTHFAGTLVVDFPNFIQTHPATLGAAVVRGFHDTLMAGFTSVRDMGSYATEVAPLVDAGVILGPNVFGAGAAIGITGGSCDACTLPGDFVMSRQGTSPNNQWPGVSTLVNADGIDECRRAVRQQIRRGAKCIKIVATGGILSTTDDPQYRQYSDKELHALVGEAHLQGRAVAIHAHGKLGIMAAIRAGAHTIEHGSYIDDEAAELMVARNVSLVATRTVIEAGLKNLDSLNPPTARKMVNVAEQHRQAYATAVRKGVKIALGTDICGSNPTTDTAHGKNGVELVYAVQAGLTPLQAIEAGTINSAETLGPQTPKKGLIKVGWDADMIALDESPLDNIHLFANPESIKYVWKGAILVKSPKEQMLWPRLKE
ncbi:Amidohydro-rel domain-containing protein [Fusarium sp. LHS14.1]|nr:Amidohydro-rel domain-containing protein [Fusarium sp. LHS14.1]